MFIIWLTRLLWPYLDFFGYLLIVGFAELCVLLALILLFVSSFCSLGDFCLCVCLTFVMISIL